MIYLLGGQDLMEFKTEIMKACKKLSTQENTKEPGNKTENAQSN